MKLQVDIIFDKHTYISLLTNYKIKLKGHTGIPGLWTLDSGCWTLDAELWTPDAGLWTLDSGLWTLDAGR